MSETRPHHSFIILVAATLFAVLVGWILYVGKSILLPIIVAVISVYILGRCSAALAKLPVLSRLPSFFVTLLVLVLFTAVVLIIAAVATSTASQIAAQIPEYEANANQLLAQVTSFFNLHEKPDLQTLTTELTKSFSISELARLMLTSIASAGSAIVLVVVYAVFLLAEKKSLPQKLHRIFPDPQDAENVHRIASDINRQIGDYLTVKTMINAFLAAMSLAVMLILGVDYALFWAICIGLLNYIPYVGSFVGVLFPVALSVVQFGSLEKTVVLLALLSGAQMFVGNVIEPRLIGDKLNMSPFVVIVSLAVFSSLWGVPGAILAIPMTSMIAIILNAFEGSRPLAILLFGASE